MTKFEDLIDKKCKEYGSKFDDSELATQFIPYYNNGKRIKVLDYGTVVSGTVGVTTGWKPVFILIRTSRSLGSSYTLSSKNEIIGEVKRK
jgi:hypothetical protein